MVSLFSGVGGLETDQPAELLCELDQDCQSVLRQRFPDSQIASDVTLLKPRRGIDAVLGGWPCQDISVAGLKRGLKGDRSGLLFRMIDFARQSKAETIVAENVPNLLRLENGENFAWTLRALEDAGYRNIAWRTLNARQFGLPHQRRRVFIIASQSEAPPKRLLRSIPKRTTSIIDHPVAAGFYWTAGLQGINYSVGYSPTLKVGSSLSIPSPPAVTYGETVRQLSPTECVRLQGFPLTPFRRLPPKAVYRMMGNAVAKPVGEFATKSLEDRRVRVEHLLTPMYSAGTLFQEEAKIPNWPLAGLRSPDGTFAFADPERSTPLSNNLESFLDFDSSDRMSPRAARGLLSRLERSQKHCPESLALLLKQISEAPE